MKTFLLFSLIFIGSHTVVSQNITLELFKDGFTSPVDLKHAGDDRVFVVEKGGRIKIVNPDGTVNSTLFLDITGQVSTGNEQGLLGLAFHPDYTSNGYYFVNYTKTDGDTRIARFTVDPSNPAITLAGSELTIIEYSQPFSTHNGGAIAFGSDGYLYIASGDGGSGGDPGNRAQNTTQLLGKILRLDIDTPAPPLNYSIPTDNPFFGSATNAEEIWAYGLRNPWRISFDNETNNLWIADVGQENVEEINRNSSLDAGLNYGWRCYEGSQAYNTTGCPATTELTFPIAEYSSSSSTSNCSITGGYVYRGATYLDLQGLYFFADVCSGLIGTVANDGTLTELGNYSGSWVSFGVDVLNELYIISITGSIYKIQGEIVAGVSENTTSPIMMIPNPASEYVQFTSETNTLATIEIVDLKGNVVHSEEYHHISEKTISLKNYAKGLYLVKITSENGTFSIKKLIVK